jgi:hypothetical protein
MTFNNYGCMIKHHIHAGNLVQQMSKCNDNLFVYLGWRYKECVQDFVGESFCKTDT